jgi:hypothetical protein
MVEDQKIRFAVSSQIAHTNFITVVHVRCRSIAAILSGGAHTAEPVAISFRNALT